MSDRNPQTTSHRIAGWIELVLQFLTGAGIIGLVVVSVQAESLIAPGESPALIRARLLQSIFSLTVPLVILLFLTNMRIRLATLLSEQDSDRSAMKSAKYMWFLMIAFVLIIVGIDIGIIVESLGEFEFN